MKNKILAVSSLVSLLSFSTPVLAGASDFSLAKLSTPGTEQTLVLPENADASPVISLGSTVDPESGEVVEGLAFIHYKKGSARDVLASPAMRPGTQKCYTHLARGAKWKAVEPWVMNAANSRGLDPATVFATEGAALEKWEDAANGVVGDGAGVNVFGAGTMTDAALVADTVSPDGQNEVYFGDVSSSGAIAVTIVWGTFSGPVDQRKLVEWDQIYDQVDFDWSLTGEAGKMDIDNIATHENGHSAGMGHPDDSCTEETMYRFASSGETKKRDLHTGDVRGIDNLY